ncbi:MAG: hypothetical protein JST01_17980 [Cyanobacteria bacterium SZAS TMP-1]|nr:hypothetical protein [Cyanobacteria bacterium SZAS TMP-1]
MNRQSGQTKPIRFGDLLVQLQLVDAKDLHDALVVAPQFGLPLGRTLVLSGRISEEELQLVVELQPMVNQHGYSLEAARKAAHLVRHDGVPAAEALKQTGVQNTVDRATLGNMLLEAGLIDATQLAEAGKASYETGMRLGRVLVLNNYISHAALAKALEMQYMVRSKRISVDQGIEMLGSQVPKQQALALEARAVVPAPGKKQVRFGEFLVLSGMATEAEILNAMESSLNNQLSLEESIIKLGLISKRVYDRACQLHDQVCSGEMPLTQAAEEMHRMVFGAPAVPVDASGDKGDHPPVLGELLKMTGLVDDSDITEAIELSNKYPSLIGKMLVISGAIDEATLIASLRCQYLLKHGYLDLAGAIKALQYSKANKVSFDDALDNLGLRNPGIGIEREA